MPDGKAAASIVHRRQDGTKSISVDSPHSLLPGTSPHFYLPQGALPFLPQPAYFYPSGGYMLDHHTPFHAMQVDFRSTGLPSAQPSWFVPASATGQSTSEAHLRYTSNSESKHERKEELGRIPFRPLSTGAQETDRMPPQAQLDGSQISLPSFATLTQTLDSSKKRNQGPKLMPTLAFSRSGPAADPTETQTVPSRERLITSASTDSPTDPENLTSHDNVVIRNQEKVEETLPVSSSTDSPTDPENLTSRDNVVIRNQEKVEETLPVSSRSSEISAPGRLSNKAAEALARGFAELDAIISKLKVETGLSSKQILKRWQPPNPRDLNLWNIYQKYFQAHAETELARFPEDRRPSGNTQPDAETIRAAYRAFQEAEPNFASILLLFKRIHEIEGSNTTLNNRCQDFNKYVNTLKRLAESASTVNGFETIFCAVGAVVHQDQSLSETFCSPMVPDFFSDRIRFPTEEFEGHLKAHAYDHASRRALANEAETKAATAPPSSNQTEIKDGNRKLLTLLKQKVKALVDPCRIPELSNPERIFSDIPKVLAQNGWVLENWPENVPFPCDIGKGKGIAKLGKDQCELLLKSLDDPSYPLQVVKKFSKAVPASEPIIIGVSPHPESEHSCGRRKFLDEKQTEDRDGPPRRAQLSEKALVIQNAQVASLLSEKRPGISEPNDGQSKRNKRRRITMHKGTRIH